jgi:hypothetical protein
MALLEVVGVEVGAFAEPVHESGGPGGGLCDANEVQVVFDSRFAKVTSARVSIALVIPAVAFLLLPAMKSALTLEKDRAW